MEFRYRWKNGAAPSRDQAARERYLLDDSQFANENDRNLAENMVRKHLNVPVTTLDEDSSILPTALQEDKASLDRI